MSDKKTRKIKDAKDLSTDELIYFRSHAKATFMSSGSTVEDSINLISENIGSKQDAIEDLETIRSMASHKKVVAIGEIGLDYYWDKEPEVQEQQRYWFKKQMELARELGLPVVIHSRDAAQDTIDIMMEENAQEIGGVIHFYLPPCR